MALDAGASYPLVFPDAEAAEWLNCGQCEDCFKPSFGYVPTESTQYALSLSNFKAPQADGRPQRFRFGLLAATDDHTARPGTGYKQYERRKMTLTTGSMLRRVPVSASTDMEDPTQPEAVHNPLERPDGERLQSFAYPGGIMGAHVTERNREAVWAAMKRKEVYGTSGPRILLWFDLVNAPGGRLPMGGETEMDIRPHFAVRALGDFVQQPGCPPFASEGLPAERLAALCAGECYHPGDRRHPITRIEIVRIRPQASPGEPVAALIEDPWKTVHCNPETEGCVGSFHDEDFVASRRDTLYYARALQEPTPAINAAGLRTEFDEQGRPVAVNPCYGDYRTPPDDNCLAPAQERAWSSPIFVNHLQAQH